MSSNNEQSGFQLPGKSTQAIFAAVGYGAGKITEFAVPAYLGAAAYATGVNATQGAVTGVLGSSVGGFVNATAAPLYFIGGKILENTAYNTAVASGAGAIAGTAVTFGVPVALNLAYVALKNPEYITSAKDGIVNAASYISNSLFGESSQNSASNNRFSFFSTTSDKTAAKEPAADTLEFEDRDLIMIP